MIHCRILVDLVFPLNVSLRFSENHNINLNLRWQLIRANLQNFSAKAHVDVQIVY